MRTTDLQDRVREVATSLQGSLAAVLHAIDGSPRRPVALSRAIGIDKNLASRILAAIKDRDPFAVAHRLPAPQGLRMFHSAARARKHRVQPELLDELAKDIAGFEDLILQDAGDRDALNAMISGWMPDLRGSGERIRKQSIFKAMSYLLGYQVETRIAVSIIQPNQNDSDTCDDVSIVGSCGLQRLRPRAPVTVSVMGERGPKVLPPGDAFFEAVTDERDSGHFVLSEFSSNPLPSVFVHEESAGPDKVIRYMLGEGGVGPKSRVTLFLANAARRTFARFRVPERAEESFALIPWMPCRVMIHDLFIREDVWPMMQPKLTTSMLTIGDPMPPGNTSDIVDRLEMQENIQYLGKGAWDIHTKDVESYPDIIGTVFARLNWPRERFRGYRLRVQYPIPYMAYTFWFDLPSKPL